MHIVDAVLFPSQRHTYVVCNVVDKIIYILHRFVFLAPLRLLASLVQCAQYSHVMCAPLRFCQRWNVKQQMTATMWLQFLHTHFNRSLYNISHEIYKRVVCVCCRCRCHRSFIINRKLHKCNVLLVFFSFVVVADDFFCVHIFLSTGKWVEMSFPFHTESSSQPFIHLGVCVFLFSPSGVVPPKKITSSTSRE